MRGGAAPSPTRPSPHHRPGTGSWARPFAQRAPQHNQQLRRTPPANARSAHCPAKLKRKRLSNRPGGSIAIFQPPAHSPEAPPLTRGYPWGREGARTLGTAHAQGSHKRNHLATLQAMLTYASMPGRTRWPECKNCAQPNHRAPGHAHLRKHAREMWSASQIYKKRMTAAPSTPTAKG